MNRLFLTKVVGAVSAVSLTVLSSCTPVNSNNAANPNPNNPNNPNAQLNTVNPHAVPGLHQPMPGGSTANAPYQQFPNPNPHQPHYIPDPAPHAGFNPSTRPLPQPGQPVQPMVTAATHKVVKGDTLTRLSRKYNVSIAAIMSANGLESANLIRIGQTLNIPGN